MSFHSSEIPNYYTLPERDDLPRLLRALTPPNSPRQFRKAAKIDKGYLVHIPVLTTNAVKMPERPAIDIYSHPSTSTLFYPSLASTQSLIPIHHPFSL